MTELEALRRVAEAARAWINGTGDAAMRNMVATASALAVLDALPAPAAAAEGETVEVRGVVGWDRRTKRWGIRGWSDETHEEHETTIRRCGMDVVATIRARVPLPSVPEVTGEAIAAAKGEDRG